MSVPHHLPGETITAQAAPETLFLDIRREHEAKAVDMLSGAGADLAFEAVTSFGE
jgi:hypothetical protein